MWITLNGGPVNGEQVEAGDEESVEFHVDFTRDGTECIAIYERDPRHPQAYFLQNQPVEDHHENR